MLDPVPDAALVRFTRQADIYAGGPENVVNLSHGLIVVDRRM